VRVTYDPAVDAAYIYLVEIPPGRVASTHVCDVEVANGSINLDFDRDGKLLGLEVLGATRLLPHEVLHLAPND